MLALPVQQQPCPICEVQRRMLELIDVRAQARLTLSRAMRAVATSEALLDELDRPSVQHATVNQEAERRAPHAE